jgi:hypothetical protein
VSRNFKFYPENIGVEHLFLNEAYTYAFLCDESGEYIQATPDEPCAPKTALQEWEWLSYLFIE